MPGREKAMASEAGVPRALWRVRDARSMQPEKRLMLAVLEDAMRAFKEYAVVSNPHVRRLYAEVERWFDSPPTGWLFDFENICDALGLEPSSIRWSLQPWRAAPPPDASRRDQPSAAARAGGVGA